FILAHPRLLSQPVKRTQLSRDAKPLQDAQVRANRFARLRVDDGIVQRVAAREAFFGIGDEMIAAERAQTRARRRAHARDLDGAAFEELYRERPDAAAHR